jgi:hypothetical protein
MARATAFSKQGSVVELVGLVELAREASTSSPFHPLQDRAGIELVCWGRSAAPVTELTAWRLRRGLSSSGREAPHNER